MFLLNSLRLVQAVVIDRALQLHNYQAVCVHLETILQFCLTPRFLGVNCGPVKRQPLVYVRRY
jgi:hypothetical protein